MSDKDHGTKIQTIASHLPGLMDLKVFKHFYLNNKYFSFIKIYFSFVFKLCLGVFTYVAN